MALLARDMDAVFDSWYMNSKIAHYNFNRLATIPWFVAFVLVGDIGTGRQAARLPMKVCESFKHLSLSLCIPLAALQYVLQEQIRPFCVLKASIFTYDLL